MALVQYGGYFTTVAYRDNKEYNYNKSDRIKPFLHDRSNSLRVAAEIRRHVIHVKKRYAYDG